MAFSMHSHSGEFCPGHAKDNLEDVILTAISRGMKTFALTEHMPRESEEDLYPEEVCSHSTSSVALHSLLDPNPSFCPSLTQTQVAAGHTISLLPPRHALYLAEATRLRQKYASQIHILIGFEGEWIRSSYGPFIKTYAADPLIDFFIGSVHHVHGIPIDYDAATYAKAVQKAGSEERLFGDYYDLQYEMLQELKPRVVGHFDLIRLLASDPSADLKTSWDGRIWGKAVRNLKWIKKQGGLLEVNSAGLRKGLKEPYPGRGIAEAWRGMGGRFTLSDDSHGVVQVGTNYLGMLGYLDGLGVEEVWTFQKVEGGELVEKKVELSEVRATFKGSEN